MPDETNSVNNAASCYKEGIQLSAPFLCHCLPVFDKICEMAMNLYYSIQVTISLIKIANTPVNRSATLVLSAIN